jgi:hypothetical protein
VYGLGEDDDEIEYRRHLVWKDSWQTDGPLARVCLQDETVLSDRLHMRDIQVDQGDVRSAFEKTTAKQ